MRAVALLLLGALVVTGLITFLQPANLQRDLTWGQALHPVRRRGQPLGHPDRCRDHRGLRRPAAVVLVPAARAGGPARLAGPPGGGRPAGRGAAGRGARRHRARLRDRGPRGGGVLAAGPVVPGRLRAGPGPAAAPPAPGGRPDRAARGLARDSRLGRAGRQPSSSGGH
ncbi:hypothetical protein [Nocardioides convexus]|uniref:hypothetical protein n=1 Tax=Nocardioides convexus TaxID=2712224 RepID=UPI002418739B|nr:hypothetical protein [Nocardioides convexus]